MIADARELAEVIDTTDLGAFEHDNETGPGADVARDWAACCSSFEMPFCDELPSS